LLIKFKTEVAATIKESKPVVTKEERIKVANNFWKAFFAMHSTEDKKVVKKKRKKK